MTESKHTISSALRRCKQLAGDIATATSRAIVAVSYDEARPPSYTYAEVMESREDLIDELVELRAKIALANAKTRLESGLTLAKTIHQLSQIKSEIAFLKGLPCSVQERTETTRWDVDYEVLTPAGNPTRVKKVDVTICALTERQRDEKVAELQARFSELNAEVERLNHTTRLP